MKNPSPDKQHKCTIILDTNQFIRDLPLSETRWEILLDYVNKTEASIMMPSLVWDELRVNYLKRINEQLKKTQDCTQQYNNLVGFNSEHHEYYGHQNRIEPPQPTLSADKLIEPYLAYVKSKLNLKARHFLHIDNEWYKEIYRRSLVHQKPFSDDSDKGFKDSILWKSILSLSNRPGFKEAPVVFISANTRDFCESKNHKALHPDLLAEAAKHELDIYFFDGLDRFFEEWSADALNIDFNKIKKSIPLELINAALLPHAAKLMSRSARKYENILILGMSFKVGEVDGKNKKLEISISGSLTNTLAACTYLDFSAEAIFHDNENNQTITIQRFSPEQLPSFD